MKLMERIEQILFGIMLFLPTIVILVALLVFLIMKKTVKIIMKNGHSQNPAIFRAKDNILEC